jgi:DnaJ-class molecular chaperone
MVSIKEYNLIGSLESYFYPRAVVAFKIFEWVDHIQSGRRHVGESTTQKFQQKTENQREHNRQWTKGLREEYLTMKLLCPLSLCILLCLLCQSVHCNSWNGDPYQILAVPKDASQNDIKKRYRELCLRYHPDKNVNKPESERKKCESIFKTVQKANSLIGDAESRANYDRIGSNPFHREYAQSSAFSSSPRAGDPFAEAVYRAFASGVNLGRGNSGFSSSPFRTTSSFSNSFSNLGGAGSTLKSIYIQKVSLPLHELYKGGETKFTLKDNIWKRYRAAFRGGAAWLNLYQALMYAIPCLRLSRYIALAVGCLIFHSTLPRPQQTVYPVHLQPGYKGGKTKLAFKSNKFGQPEVIFVLEEERHARYRRIDDDLHTTATITPRKARHGCTLSVKSLDEQESPMQIRLQPNQIQMSGDQVRIPGRGWPIRHARDDKERGDVIVRIIIQKPPRRKSTGK